MKELNKGFYKIQIWQSFALEIFARGYITSERHSPRTDEKGVFTMRTTKLVIIIFAMLMIFPAYISALADEGNSPAKVSITTLNLELKDTSVIDAIAALFKATDAKYYIQPGVGGKIASLSLKNVTFDQALKAITDAAGLTYTIENGSYVIGPMRADIRPQQSVIMSSPAQYGTGAVGSAGQALNPSQLPQDQAANQPNLQQGVPPTQVVINQPPAPVYYGQPAPPPVDYGYYPPVYQYGNMSIFGNGLSSVVVAGGNPNIMSYGPPPPPPLGYVSTDVLRFLRSQYFIRNGSFFITPY